MPNYVFLIAAFCIFIMPKTINSLIEKYRDEDRRKFEKWLSEPIEMYYVMRIIPTIYLSYDIPSNINCENEAIIFVAGIAREKHKNAALFFPG